MNFPDILMEEQSIDRLHQNGELHQYSGAPVFWTCTTIVVHPHVSKLHQYGGVTGF